MNPLVLLLIVISAFLHIYWNFTLKKSISKGGDYVIIPWLANIISLIIYLPVFIVLLNIFNVTMRGFLFAASCGLVFAVYSFLISKGYSKGDLSHVYPLSKITPLFTLLIGIFYLKENVSMPALAGILLIVFGAYSIHLKSFKQLLSPIISLRHSASILAFSAAVATAIYGLLSKLGSAAINPFLFVYIAYFFLIIFYVPFLFFKTKNILKQFTAHKKAIIKIGAVDLGGFSLVVIALSLSQLSSVFALRQVSVIFSVLAGRKLLKEGGNTRLIAASIIFLGVLLVSIF